MKVCLITPGQPSSNPRLVKEADALVGAGYDVHVIASYFADWATDEDRALLASRRWTMTFVDWRQSVAPGLFHYSRLRHFGARTLAERLPAWSPLAIPALARVGPELLRAAMAVDADLYVAHNLAALPIAGMAARAKGARASFDAEDFHSGQLSETREARQVKLVRAIESRWLPSCAFVTAAAPAIADAYREDYGLRLPTTILNVFPLSERPASMPAPSVGGPLTLYWFSQTIGPDRGLEDVVDAMAKLRGHAIELHLRGTWQAGFETHLRGRATAAGLDATRIVYHLPAAPAEMVRLAAAYDVGLATEPGVTRNNSLLLSNKIFTYVLAGSAVLATRTAGQMRLARDLGSSVAWCDPQAPVSLAAALRGWAENRDALNAAKREAWRLGGSRFNWEAERHRYLDLVAGVLVSKPAPAAQAAGSDATRIATAPASERS